MYVSRSISGNFDEEDGPVWDETDGVAGLLAPPAGGRLGHWELKPVDPAFHDDEPGAPSPRVKESYLGSYRARGSRGVGASPFEEADASPPEPPLPVAPRDARRELPPPRRSRRPLLLASLGPKRPPAPGGGIGTPMPPLIACRRLLPRPSFQNEGASERRLHLFGTDGNLRRRWDARRLRL